MPAIRRLHRQGSSVVCTIPQYMLELCSLKSGDEVQIFVTSRKEIKIIPDPLRNKPEV